MSNEYLDWIYSLRDAPIGTEDHDRWITLMFPWVGYENSNTTKLHELPIGWQKSFVEPMLFEIKNLIEEYDIETFEILQIKEKYGTLKLYYCHETNDEFDKKISLVIEKYEQISSHTCMECGADNAKIVNIGWIYALCDNCLKEEKEKNGIWNK